MLKKLLPKPQSEEITYSGNLRVAIAYVIARLFREYQTPQSAQNLFFIEECSTLSVPPKIK